MMFGDAHVRVALSDCRRHVCGDQPMVQFLRYARHSRVSGGAQALADGMKTPLFRARLIVTGGARWIV